MKKKTDHELLKYCENNLKELKRIQDALKSIDTFADISITVDGISANLNLREFQIHLHDQIFLFERLKQRTETRVNNIQKFIDNN